MESPETKNENGVGETITADFPVELQTEVLHGGTEGNPPDKDIEKEKIKLLASAKRTTKAYNTPEKKFSDYDDSSDSQDCMTCFTCCSKKRKPCKELCVGENINHLIRWWTKWLVFIIGMSNFLQAMHEMYKALQFQMKFDYFYAIGIYNCKEWMTLEGYQFLLFVNTIHAITSSILLFANSKKAAPFILYWTSSQILLTSTNIINVFFQLRFSQFEDSQILTVAIILVVVDVIEITIALFRFYLLDKPYEARLRQLTGGSSKLDRTLNGDLFIRASVFLQKKSAVREAANFQILAVVKKLREIFTATGMRPTPDVVEREVKEALEALKDKSKYPGLRKLQISELDEDEFRDAKRKSSKRKSTKPDERKTIREIMNPSLSRQNVQLPTWAST